MGEELGQETGGREEAWYIMCEKAERAGKKVEIIGNNLFY